MARATAKRRAKRLDQRSESVSDGNEVVLKGSLSNLDETQSRVVSADPRAQASAESVDDEKTLESDAERRPTQVSPTVCPECSKDLETEGTETVCGSCGLVVDENSIDHGPEWRNFEGGLKYNLSFARLSMATM